MTPNHRLDLDGHGVQRRNPRASKLLAAASQRTVGRTAVGRWPGPRASAVRLRPVAASPARRTSQTTNTAETRRREIFDSSTVRTNAQSRAQLESPRARVPYTAGGEFSLATVLRGSAHTAYSKRFLDAYGSHRPRTRTPSSKTGTKFPASPAHRRREPELPSTVTFARMSLPGHHRVQFAT